MITYAALKKNPRLFRNLTGLGISQFDKLYAAVEPAWTAGECNRLSRPHCQRAIGGGRDYAIDLREQLLMTLMWRRLNLNTTALYTR